MPAFGRIPSAPDLRDAQYPMRAVLPRTIAIVSKTWPIGPVMNQGEEPFCVGYASKQFLQAEPIATMDGPTAPEIYHAAQERDEWPGVDYEGTSVRGAAKALTDMGRMTSYVWASSVTDVRDWLMTQGTVIMGTSWRANMMRVDRTGVLSVSGRVVGGHAYLLIGYDAQHNRYRMVNSWGEGWGQKGQAWINAGDLQKLLAADGEACAAVELAINPETTLQSQMDALRLRVDALERSTTGR